MVISSPLPPIAIKLDLHEQTIPLTFLSKSYFIEILFKDFPYATSKWVMIE